MRAAILLVCASACAAEDAMVLIPAGEFTMGRTKLTADDKTTMRPVVLLDDRPDHRVRLDAYWIDKTEVTHGAYAKFLAATGHRKPYHWAKRPADDYPIYNVDWDDARAYCTWAGKRLPSEAEWERAARGGLDGMSYPWGDKADTKHALYNVQTGPGPVGKYPPNGFGVYDMAGSVSEWTADWFEREYYAHSPAANPRGPETGTYKVIRGGSWADSPARITTFFRNWVRPNQRTPNLGFRCVKDSP
jgi:formylglycine-generating enzyme required for sulfatase activity